MTLQQEELFNTVTATSRRLLNNITSIERICSDIQDSIENEDPCTEQLDKMNEAVLKVEYEARQLKETCLKIYDGNALLKYEVCSSGLECDWNRLRTINPCNNEFETVNNRLMFEGKFHMRDTHKEYEPRMAKILKEKRSTIFITDRNSKIRELPDEIISKSLLAFMQKHPDRKITLHDSREIICTCFMDTASTAGTRIIIEVYKNGCTRNVVVSEPEYAYIADICETN
jgi:hypothetical protein